MFFFNSRFNTEENENIKSFVTIAEKFIPLLFLEIPMSPFLGKGRTNTLVSFYIVFCLSTALYFRKRCHQISLSFFAYIYIYIYICVSVCIYV